MNSNQGRRAPLQAVTTSASPDRTTEPLPAVTAVVAGPYRLEALVCLLLAGVTLATYAHACDNGFVYDDEEYVVTNRHVTEGLSGANVLWALTAFHSANWHPLTWLSLQLDATLFGPGPSGFHLTNVLLHAADTLLLFLFWRYATGAVWRSALVAALFALHPLHVESVAWVSERKDVLSGLFFMLTLLAYAWYARRPGWRRYLLVLLPFALGLLAKPMLVTLPCLLLLLDYWPLRRWPQGSAGERALPLRTLLWEKVPLFGLAALSCLVTVQAQFGAGSAPSLVALPLPVRLGNALLAYVGYLRKMVWPSGLAAYYHYEISAAVWPVAVSAALLLAVTALAVFFRRRAPYFLVGWLWYLGTLVPVIGLVQVGGQALADRYTYLPLVGVFVAAAWGLGDLASRWRCRALVVPMAVAALSACALLTWLQVHFWQDEVSLWTHALEVEPNNPMACNLLGMACLREGELTMAEGYFAAFVRLEPQWALAHARLGMVLASEQRWDEAEQCYTRALQLDSSQPDAHYGLGVIAFLRGRLDAAAEHFEAALRQRPESATLHHHLGLVWEYRAAWQDAEARYRRAVELDPGSALYRRDLALALWECGQTGAAGDEYREASRLEPGWEQKANQQARTRATSRDPQARDGKAALHMARQVCQASGERDPAFLDTLAAAHAEMGQFGQAAATARRALALAEAGGDSRLAGQIRERLALYEAGRPLREGPPSPS